jgi:hypothetical protein
MVSRCIHPSTCVSAEPPSWVRRVVHVAERGTREPRAVHWSTPSSRRGDIVARHSHRPLLSSPVAPVSLGVVWPVPDRPASTSLQSLRRFRG